jgi:hypothetical protein
MFDQVGKIELLEIMVSAGLFRAAVARNCELSRSS